MMAWGQFWANFHREIKHICQSKWDFALTLVVPLLVIVLFAAMFYQGKAQHLPVAVIDNDHSQLSQTIIHHIENNHNLHIAVQSVDLSDAYQALNRLEVGGYIHIPDGAQVRLVRGEDANIHIASNQSFFSIGTGVSSGLTGSAKSAIKDFLQEHFANNLPHVSTNVPHIKTSLLFNPNLSYELFLAPFIVPAVLHLLLCCLIAFAIGQEFKKQTVAIWLGSSPVAALFGKISVYVAVIGFYTALWLVWLMVVRGWWVAGSLAMLVVGYGLFYLSYALFAAMVVLVNKDAGKSFGILAIYGGSSMSFAGVSLPLNNAPRFTQIWSEIIPFTSFARLQTQTWVMGSPNMVVVPNLLILLLFVLIFGLISVVLVKKMGRV